MIGGGGVVVVVVEAAAADMTAGVRAGGALAMGVGQTLLSTARSKDDTNTRPQVLDTAMQGGRGGEEKESQTAFHKERQVSHKQLQPFSLGGRKASLCNLLGGL